MVLNVAICSLQVSVIPVHILVEGGKYILHGFFYLALEREEFYSKNTLLFRLTRVISFGTKGNDKANLHTTRLTCFQKEEIYIQTIASKIRKLPPTYLNMHVRPISRSGWNLHQKRQIRYVMPISDVFCKKICKIRKHVGAVCKKI